jgi:hypothetical protein
VALVLQLQTASRALLRQLQLLLLHCCEWAAPDAPAASVAAAAATLGALQEKCSMLSAADLLIQMAAEGFELLQLCCASLCGRAVLLSEWPAEDAALT